MAFCINTDAYYQGTKNLFNQRLQTCGKVQATYLRGEFSLS